MTTADDPAGAPRGAPHDASPATDAVRGLDLEAAHPDVLVLVGTQTGNSELVADALAETLGELGFAAHVLDMADAVPEMLADYRQIVSVTCTWSNGTFPDNAVAFAEAFEELRPPLAHAAYGVVGLGDHDYDPYFLTAAYRLDALFEACGAHRALPVCEIDGGPHPADFEAVRAWTVRLAAAFAARAAAAA